MLRCSSGWSTALSVHVKTGLKNGTGKKPKECISSSEVSVETGTNQHGIPGKQISGSVSVVCCSEPPGVSQTRLPPGDQTAVAESESKSVCFCKLPLSCCSLNGVRSLQSTENISILLSEAHF